MRLKLVIVFAIVALGAVIALVLGGPFRSTADASFSSRSAVQHRPTKVSKDEPTNPFDTKAMHAYVATRSGDITAAIYDMTDGKTFLYRPGITEQTASIVKVDILATLLWQEQSTSSSLDDDDQSLATQMIEDSNDDDATSLWNEVGGSVGITQFNKLAGLTDTAANTQGYWGETMTTALDQIQLLKHVVSANALLDNSSRAYELNLMEHVVSDERWGVSNGPSQDVTVALKDGWVPIVANNWQINSIGYVDGGGRRYLIAVLTNENATESYGMSTTEGISGIVWSELAPVAKR